MVLTALRRRDDWLEVRLVAQTTKPTTARIRGPFDEAREADLLGRPGGAMAMQPGRLDIPLEPWEIRTVHVRATGGDQPGG